jgi:hypothetical protein
MGDVDEKGFFGSHFIVSRVTSAIIYSRLQQGYHSERK